MAKRPLKKTIDEDKEELKKSLPIKKTKPAFIKKAAPKRLKPNEGVNKKSTPKVAIKKVIKPSVNEVEISTPIPISERVGPAKTKRLSDDKYIRIANDSDIEKFKEMSLRVQSGSIQWAYFAIDGDKGYHYYLVLKKE